LVKYSYLADGSKASALKGNGEGLVYRGSLIYRRASDTTLRWHFTGKEEQGPDFNKTIKLIIR
jgi:hypothetical protein